MICFFQAFWSLAKILRFSSGYIVTPILSAKKNRMACGSWDIGCSPVLGDQSGGSTYRLRLRSACSVANKRLSVEFDARCKGPPGGCNFWGSKVTPKRTHNEVGDLWLGREIFASFLYLEWWQWCFFFGGGWEVWGKSYEDGRMMVMVTLMLRLLLVKVMAMIK